MHLFCGLTSWRECSNNHKLLHCCCSSLQVYFLICDWVFLDDCPVSVRLRRIHAECIILVFDLEKFGISQTDIFTCTVVIDRIKP